MNSNTTQHRHNFSIFRLSIVAFLLLSIVSPIKADAFRSTSPYRIDSRQMDVTQVDPSTSYQSYESTIYDPFSEEAPSSSSGNNGPSKIGGRQNSFVDRPDTPPAPGSPIGEAWVMLLFAAAAAIVIALRKKQTA